MDTKATDKARADLLSLAPGMPHRQVRVRAKDEGGASLYGVRLRHDTWTALDLTGEQLNELGDFDDVVLDDGNSPIKKTAKKIENDPTKKTDASPMDDANPNIKVTPGAAKPSDVTGKG